MLKKKKKAFQFIDLAYDNFNEQEENKNQDQNKYFENTEKSLLNISEVEQIEQKNNEILKKLEELQQNLQINQKLTSQENKVAQKEDIEEEPIILVRAKEIVPNQKTNPKNDVNNSKLESLPNKIQIDSQSKNEILTELNDLVEENKSFPIKNESKNEYFSDYSDIIDENEKEIVKEIKKEPIFNYSKPSISKKSNSFNQYQISNKSKIKSYNEFVNEIEPKKYNFNEEKIEKIISFKEKLDVKTNIYLKASIVDKIKEIQDRTNESRSSIINKLLELALKRFED